MCLARLCETLRDLKVSQSLADGSASVVFKKDRTTQAPCSRVLVLVSSRLLGQEREIIYQPVRHWGRSVKAPSEFPSTFHPLREQRGNQREAWPSTREQTTHGRPQPRANGVAFAFDKRRRCGSHRSRRRIRRGRARRPASMERRPPPHTHGAAGGPGSYWMFETPVGRKSIRRYTVELVSTARLPFNEGFLSSSLY